MLQCQLDEFAGIQGRAQAYATVLKLLKDPN